LSAREVEYALDSGSISEATCQKPCNLSSLTRSAFGIAWHAVDRPPALGVEARLFGSMRRGDVTIGSDIDILVVNCGHLDHDEIAFQIRSIESDIAVDVVFLDEVARDARSRFMAAAGEP
jgi:predicted nucleotidyltransferase